MNTPVTIVVDGVTVIRPRIGSRVKVPAAILADTYAALVAAEEDAKARLSIEAPGSGALWHRLMSARINFRVYVMAELSVSEIEVAP